MQRRPKALGVLLAVASSTAVVGGCDDHDVGVVRQRWTIEGSTEPSSCANVGAAQMRVIAVDGAGAVRATQFAACTDFQTSIRLDPGTYAIAATFLGADGQAVSRTLREEPFSVTDDEETTLVLDFSRASFLGR
jgi:hypothetical protein